MSKLMTERGLVLRYKTQLNPRILRTELRQQYRALHYMQSHDKNVDDSGSDARTYLRLQPKTAHLFTRARRLIAMSPEIRESSSKSGYEINNT